MDKAPFETFKWKAAILEVGVHYVTTSGALWSINKGLNKQPRRIESHR